MPETGPRAGTRWTERVSPEPPHRLLAAPAGDGGPAWLLPGRHRVLGAADGPVLSLTMALDRLPGPDETDVSALVCRAALDLTLDFRVPAARPLFVTSWDVALLDAGGAVLAAGTGGGEAARVALSALLERDAALAVVAALDGVDGGLMLRSSATYRAQPASARARLAGKWADVHAVAARLGTGIDLRPALRDVYRDALRGGALTCDPPAAADSAYRSFAAACRGMLLGPDGKLGPPPSTVAWLDLVVTVDLPSEPETVTIEDRLGDVLPAALVGWDRERFEHFVLWRPEDGPRPRRVAGTRADRDVDGRAGPQVIELPGQALVTPGWLFATSAARLRPAGPGLWVGHLGNQKVEQPDDAALARLPMVADEAAWVFPSRDGAAAQWYAPSFLVVPPDPARDVVFSFRREGTLAGGEPNLVARIEVRLRPGLGPEAAAAGGRTAVALPTGELTVELDLPFRDEAGQPQRQRFPAVVTWSGDVAVATVSLFGPWSRLAYGALSAPGFQTEPARVRVTWQYQGWTRQPVKIVWGHKTAELPAVLGDVPQTSFDLTAATFRAPGLTLRFGSGRGAVEPGPVATGVNAKLRPIEAEPRPRWVRGTYVRSQSIDVLFPCQDFGPCYVEERPAGPVPVGCVDALRLGQTSWRQCEELPELADPAYRVFRSLQQPGRFVVLPARYVVSRLPAGSPGGGYHPALLLYALLDGADESRDQVVIQAALAPDVTEAALAALRRRLAGYAPDPVLVPPSDLEATVSTAWTLMGVPGVSITALPQPGGFAVSVAGDLPHALLLRDMLNRSGIAGGVRWTFPDGSSMSSQLLLALTELTGPPGAGPVEVTVDGPAATLVNRIERPIAVAALRVDTGEPRLLDLPVGRTLTPGESVRLELPPEVSAGWPVYLVPPAGPAALTEIRSFVEDVRTNVVFVDQIDHAAHGLAGVTVRARLAGSDAAQEVALQGDPGCGVASFILPLTGYLRERVVEYQVGVVRPDATVQTGGWRRWDLATTGQIIPLDWSQTGLPSQELP